MAESLNEGDGIISNSFVVNSIFCFELGRDVLLQLADNRRLLSEKWQKKKEPLKQFLSNLHAT